MTSRKPPPPAPVTLTPVAPAASACSTARSIRSFDTPDASCRLVSQPCRIALPTASTSPLRRRSLVMAARSLQKVQLRKRGGDVRRLLAEDRVGAPGDAGVEEHDLALERPAVDRGELDLVGDHVGPGAEIGGRGCLRARRCTGLVCRCACRKGRFRSCRPARRALHRRMADLGMPRGRAAGRP